MKLPILIAALALASPAFAGDAVYPAQTEGCYFGICPESAPAGEPARPETPAPLPADPGRQPPQVQPAFPVQPPRQPQYSGICTTLAGACWMNDFYPVGNGCWCPGAYGPITGIVTLQ